ncbi:MAG: ABC transporter ATP-binding protein, partial [Clostridiales bacterium]
MNKKNKQPKAKKESILKKLTPYADNKKYLFSLSLILSAISAVLGLLPFVFIWLIAKEIFADTANITFQSVSFYAWMTLASAFASML